MIKSMEQMELFMAVYCKTFDKFQKFEAEGSQQLTVSGAAGDDIWEYKDSLFIV